MLTPEDVLIALRNWHNVSFVESKLAELYLVRRYVRETHQLLHSAIVEIIERGLDQLFQSNPLEVQLLMRRFRDGINADEVALEVNLSTSHFYTWQNRAIKYLTTSINHLEETAWHEQQRTMLQRLDRTTSQSLVGIEGHLAHLIERLNPASNHWIVAIEGIGGIGKTSLADATVRKIIAEKIYDEVAWVTARQERMNASGMIVTHAHSTLSAMELIEAIFEQLLPNSLEGNNVFSHEQQMNLLTMQLKDWPHLIVIDNLETVVDLETLLPTLNALANPTKFLLTSRTSLYSEANIFHFHVPELDLPYAIEFIRKEIANRNLTNLTHWDDAEIRAVTAVTGGNPLAIRLVVGQANLHDYNLILEQLRAVDDFPTGNLFTYIYQHSWDHLNEEQQRLFLTLLLVNPQGDTVDTIVTFSNLPRTSARRAISHLIAINLVDVAGDANHHVYRVHGLTRTFLREKIIFAENSVPGRPTPHQAYYAATLERGLLLVEQQVADETSVTPLAPIVRDRALNLLAHAWPYAAFWERILRLLRTLIPKMERAGQRDQWIPYLEKAVEMSEAIGDGKARAELSLAIGQLYRLRSNYVLGYQWLTAALTLFEADGDRLGAANSLNELAYLAWRQHRFEATIEFANRALALVPEESLERAMSLSALGLVATDRLEWVNAENFHRQALAIRTQLGNQRQIAWSIQNLAAALRGQKRSEEAIQYFEQAIDLLEAVRDPLNGAVTKMNLGILYSVQGQADKALSAYLAAEIVFREVGDSFNLAKAYVNKGIEYLGLQQWRAAEQSFLASSQLFSTLEDTNEYLNALDGLGMCYLAQERFEEAEAIFLTVMAESANIAPDTVFYQMLHPQKIAAQIEQARRGKQGLNKGE